MSFSVSVCAAGITLPIAYCAFAPLKIVAAAPAPFRVAPLAPKSGLSVYVPAATLMVSPAANVPLAMTIETVVHGNAGVPHEAAVDPPLAGGATYQVVAARAVFATTRKDAAAATTVPSGTNARTKRCRRTGRRWRAALMERSFDLVAAASK
jgi:hypothetical protein